MNDNTSGNITSCSCTVSNCFCCQTPTYVARLPWICSRCSASNGPHVDRCGCSPYQTYTYPIYPYTPYWTTTGTAAQPLDPNITITYSGTPRS